MTDNVLDISASVAKDVLALLGIPANSATSIFNAFLRSELNQASEILYDELRSGNVSAMEVADSNEMIAVVYRYLIAARDGAARRNMRLLAKSIVGLLKRDRLYSDEFNKYAGVLENLTRDQIVYVGRYYANYQQEMSKANDEGEARILASERTVADLVPSEFPSEDHLLYLVSQLTGHGLLIAASAWGGLVYRFSPLMDEIAKLTDFQEIIQQDCT